MREEFSKLLSETEDWLYDEGEDQAKKVYVEHLQELKKHSDPVVEREREHHQRPIEFDELGKVLIHYEKILAVYSEGVSLSVKGRDGKIALVSRDWGGGWSGIS